MSAGAGCTAAFGRHQGDNSLYNIPTAENMTDAYISSVSLAGHCRIDALLYSSAERSMLGADTQLNFTAGQQATFSTASTQAQVSAASAWGMTNQMNVITPNLHEYVQLVAMRSSSCALYVGGKVRCWGLNSDGRLGQASSLGDIGDDELPSAVSTLDLGGEKAAFISGLSTVCVVTYQQKLVCWGENSFGKLGRGNSISSNTPGQVGLSAGALRVAVGSFHVCALLVDGDVQCWGSGVNGKLGYDNENSVGDTQSVHDAALGPVTLALPAIDIAVGDGHSCALYSTHAVACWGEGANGALGYGASSNVADAPARSLGSATVSLPSGHGFAVQVVANGDFTCVLFSEGSVSCWGRSPSGETGMGSTTTWGDDSGELPSGRGVLALGGTAVYLTAGSSHACAILLTGKVQCWGSNGDGQLGVGDLEDVGAEPSRIAQTVGPIRLADHALSISAGGFHTCWIERGGGGRCIGRGTLGRLGYGNTEDIGDDESSLGSQRLLDYVEGDIHLPGLGSPSCPILATNTPTWLTKIVPGISHTCLLYASGSLRCFGSNSDGRLGLGKPGDIGLDRLPYSAPEISMGGKVIDVSANTGTCALLEGGSVACWGHGDNGINGYGSTDALGSEQTPAEIGAVSVSPDSRKVLAVSRGGENVCVIMDDGKVRCWGRGGAGTNGQGNTDNIGDTPSTLPSTGSDLDFGVEVAVKLSVGRVHACFVMHSGVVYCIGGFASGRLGTNQDSNSIGNNEAANFEGPVPIVGAPTITVVDVGCVDAHTCVLRSDSKVQCWGSNEYGQLALRNDDSSNLGDNAGENGVSNVANLLRDVVQIAVAFSHTCVLFDDGTVACYGRGSFGRLGYGDEQDFGLSSSHDFARRVSLHGSVIALSTESLGTCVIYKRGAYSCWGSGFNGRLGTGNQNRIGDDEVPSDILSQSGTPSDLLLPWSGLTYSSFAEATCPGSFKALLNPRIISIPPSARTNALRTVPGWFSNLMSIASGLDAPDFPAGSSLLCAQMQGSTLLLQPSEPGARSRSNRAFCRWPDDWARLSKVSAVRVTVRDGATPILLATTGGDTIMLHGRLWPFALVEEIGLPSITLGSRPCTDVSLVSISRLTCVAPPLSVAHEGGNVSISVSHFIPSEPSPVLVDAKASYSPPRLIAADPPVDILFTGQSILLIGQFLGDIPQESPTQTLSRDAIRVDLFDMGQGGSAVALCNVTKFWDSGIRCDMPPRVQHSLGVVFAQISVADQVSSRRAELKYAVPSISALVPNFVLTPDIGPQVHVFDVVGAFFGTPASHVRIFVEHMECDTSTRVSASRATCRVDDSAALRFLGTRATVKIDVDNSNATAVGALRIYGKITLTPIAPQSLPRDGRSIVLSGTEFGRFPSSDPSLSASADIVSVKFGPSGGTACSNIQVTGDSLSCDVPPGLGALSPVAIVRQNGSSQQASAELAYSAARIASVHPAIVLSAPATSSSRVTLVLTGTGFDFAVPVGPPPPMNGNISGTPCPGGGLTVHNVTTMSCDLLVADLKPSSNPSTSVKLFQAGLAVTVDFSVAFTATLPPTVSAVQPSIVPAPGNVRVLLIGAGFGAGRQQDITSVYVSAAECTAVLVVDSFSLSCLVPPANIALSASSGTVADVVLTTASGASYTFVGGLSYSRPEILTVSGGEVQVHPPTASAVTTIVAGGLNLYDGLGGATQLSVGNLTCTSLGGTMSFAPSGRTAECRDLRLALLPQLRPGASELSFIGVTTALGQETRSTDGSVRITGPPLIGLLSPVRLG